MKGHTGVVFTFEKGTINGNYTKQKTNSRISTEAELQGVDEKIGNVLWTKIFI